MPDSELPTDLRSSPRASITPPTPSQSQPLASTSTSTTIQTAIRQQHQLSSSALQFDMDRGSITSSPSITTTPPKDDLHQHQHHHHAMLTNRSTPSPHTPPLSKLDTNTKMQPQHQSINDRNSVGPTLASASASATSSMSSAIFGAGASSSSSNAQQFCLRWNNYQTNLTNVFDQLLQNESFVDVTLACDGNSIKAHKMVLSACSPYFQSLFFDNPCQHPIVIMRDVKWPELTAVVEFMYKGEINVRQEQIAPLLRVAEMLKIRGLADVKSDLDLNSESENLPQASPQSIFSDQQQQQQQQQQLHQQINNAEQQQQQQQQQQQHQQLNKKPRITARTEWQINNLDLGIESIGSGTQNKRDSNSNIQQLQQNAGHSILTSVSASARHFANRKKRCPSAEIKRNASASPLSLIEQRNDLNASPAQQSPSSHTSATIPSFLSAANSIDAITMASLLPNASSDDLEIKPGIAEMIREEERAKLLQNSQAWLNAAPSTTLNKSYQYQLQSMWQKCWNTNQNLVHHLRFRERGPLKSWRPETMADAIMSVLKDGLSLSQAARKYDIPYPTFVLYANRVHNMLGPSIDGGSDLRPKGRGRPQRILLGVWPEDHIKGVVKTVVFRDDKELREDNGIPMPEFDGNNPMFPFPNPQIDFSATGQSNNGALGLQLNELDTDQISPINISRNNLNWSSLVNASGSRSTSSRCSS